MCLLNNVVMRMCLLNVVNVTVKKIQLFKKTYIYIMRTISKFFKKIYIYIISKSKYFTNLKSIKTIKTIVINTMIRILMTIIRIICTMMFLYVYIKNFFMNILKSCFATEKEDIKRDPIERKMISEIRSHLSDIIAQLADRYWTNIYLQDYSLIKNQYLDIYSMGQESLAGYIKVNTTRYDNLCSELGYEALEIIHKLPGIFNRSAYRQNLLEEMILDDLENEIEKRNSKSFYVKVWLRFHINYIFWRMVGFLIYLLLNIRIVVILFCFIKILLLLKILKFKNAKKATFLIYVVLQFVIYLYHMILKFIYKMDLEAYLAR